MMVVALAACYMFIVGVTFIVVAKTTEHPDDPWVTPVPFFASILWPLSLPLLSGVLFATRMGSKTEGKAKKQQREIDEAMHRKRLAEIAAEELEIQERLLFREVKYND